MLNGDVTLDVRNPFNLSNSSKLGKPDIAYDLLTRAEAAACFLEEMDDYNDSQI